MATVIDSLVIELGLDPKKFTAGQKQALADFKRLQEEGESRAKQVEERQRRIGTALEDIGTKALNTFALFTGGKGLVEFFTGMQRANASVGRLSRNIGVSVETLTKWQAAARIFGGSAEGMAASFTQISDAFAGWKIGVVTPMIADFRAISAAGGIVIDMNDGVAKSMENLAENLKRIHDRDPAQAGLLGRRLGLDPAFFDLLIRGRAGMKEVLDYVEKIGTATTADANAAGELEKRWNQIGVRLESIGNESGIAKNILKFSDWLNLPAGEALESAKKWFTAPLITTGRPAASQPKSLFSNTEGAFKSDSEKEAFIRAEAGRRGIDPDVAMAVAKSEGFNKYSGDQGTSFGAFQLHYKNNIPGLSNGGLGDVFTKQTGLDARDPATEREQIKFALDQAASGGWGPWHGWRGSPTAGGAGRGDINVQNMTINTQATDAAGIAKDVRANVVRQQSNAAQANGGQN